MRQLLSKKIGAVHTKSIRKHSIHILFQFLNDQNIKFAPKSENPPYTREILCIEDLWGLIKEEVYKDGWEEAGNLEQLRSEELVLYR